MKKCITILIYLMSTMSVVVAQDIHFSQYNYTPLLMNPALTGALDGSQRVMINYKNQWSSIANPYETYTFCGDIGLYRKADRKKYVGLGVILFSDMAGDTRFGTTQASFSASYHLPVSPHSIISTGFQAGIAQRSLSGNDLRWDNQYDKDMGYNSSMSSFEPGKMKSMFFGDYAAGFRWNYSTDANQQDINKVIKTNLGMAFYHINQPKINFYDMVEEKTLIKLVAHGDLSLPLNQFDNTVLQPSFLLLKQGASTELIAGSMVRRSLKKQTKSSGKIIEAAVSLGAYYRLKDALIISTVIEYDNFTLGLSYDINTSGLKAASNNWGGPEISIRFINPGLFNKLKRKYRVSF